MVIKKIRFLLDELLYGCHFISLSVASYSVLASIYYGLNINYLYFFAIYLITQIGLYYNLYSEYCSDFETNLNRTLHIKTYKRYIPFIIIVLTLILLFLIAVNFIYLENSFIYLFFLAFFLIIYTKFFKSFSKYIPTFKDFYTVFYAFLSIILYYYFLGLDVNLIYLIFPISVFLRVLIQVSFFDIKDLKSDSAKQVNTIPIILKDKTYSFLNLLSIASSLMLVFSVLAGVLNIKFLFLSILYLLHTPISIHLLKGDFSKKFVYYFFIAGEGFIYLFITLIFLKIYNIY